MRGNQGSPAKQWQVSRGEGTIEGRDNVKQLLFAIHRKQRMGLSTFSLPTGVSQYISKYFRPESTTAEAEDERRKMFTTSPSSTEDAAASPSCPPERPSSFFPLILFHQRNPPKTDNPCVTYRFIPRRFQIHNHYPFDM